MTNAPEGRTYIDYHWDVRKGAREYFDTYKGWRYAEKDITQVQTPHVVPNGKWVMERPPIWAWLVGVKYDELEELPYTDKSGLRHVLYICDKPFGYVTALDGEYVLGHVSAVPVGRRHLVCAQQIHKGELGQTVPFNRIPYVRANDKKKGNGWIRLSDLMEASGLSSEEIIFGYWNHASERLFDIVLTNDENAIKGVVPNVCHLTREQMNDMLMMSDPSEAGAIWVRRGFAYTVLRLLALDVRPELHQFA